MKWTLCMLPVLLLTGLAGCLGDDGSASAVHGLDRFGPIATFREPVTMACPSPPTYMALGLAGLRCDQFGEPQLEVAGDATIWYSTVCCVGMSPAIWISRDDGYTFEALPFADGTGIVRDAFGIEGDFAIDDAGNVYFFDIAAATAYLTKYAADTTHIHTKPDIFPPLVDRPWVRAGAEDEVFIFYNTGAAGTNFFRSTDGGLTWDYPGYTNFPCPLMSLGQGGERDQLMVGGCSGDPAVWRSNDGGVSWGGRIDLPTEAYGVDYGAYEQYLQPAGDINGTFYAPVTHTIADGEQRVISVYRIDPDDSVAGPWMITPPDGLAEKPWSLAGKDGVVAFAYYQAEAVSAADEGDAIWHLMLTYTLNGLDADPTWHTVKAQDEPVLEGVFGRALGDLLQIRATPDGRAVIAYGHRDAPDAAMVSRFVSTEAPVDFGPEVFRNGP